MRIFLSAMRDSCKLTMVSVIPASLPNGTRYLVAISGIPGSGKTTLSAEVGTRVNACWKLKHYDTDANEPAIVVSMDGYHLTKAQLDTFEVCNFTSPLLW